MGIRTTCHTALLTVLGGRVGLELHGLLFFECVIPLSLRRSELVTFDSLLACANPAPLRIISLLLLIAALQCFSNDEERIEFGFLFPEGWIQCQAFRYALHGHNECFVYNSFLGAHSQCDHSSRRSRHQRCSCSQFISRAKTVLLLALPAAAARTAVVYAEPSAVFQARFRNFRGGITQPMREHSDPPVVVVHVVSGG